MSACRPLQEAGHPPVQSRPPALVQVWQVDLALTGDRLTRAAGLLSQVELARAERGTAAVRRRRIALRAALRTILGQVLACAPAHVPLATDAGGRPHLDLPRPRWDVNCTASDDVGLVALGRGVRVGIDIQRVAPWTDGTAAEGWLSAAELTALHALPSAHRARAATHCWTQKEAVLKAVGSGLSLPAAEVATSPGRRRGRSGRWHLSPVVVPPAFEACLATSVALPPGDAAVEPRSLPNHTSTTGSPR